MLDLIVKAVLKKESVHIKAGIGTGKTTLMKNLNEVLKNSEYMMPGSKKETLVKTANALGFETSKKNTNELLSNVLEGLKTNTAILLIDDADEVTKSTRKLLEKLLSHGLIIVTIGLENILDLPEERMPRMSDSELLKVVKGVKPSIAKLIVKECSTPSEAVLAARKAMYHDLSTKDKIHEFIAGIRTKKKELMPVWSMTVIISLLLSMRYFYYMQREFKTGYTLALIAYCLRALSSLRKKK